MEEVEFYRAVKKFFLKNIKFKQVFYDDGKNFADKAKSLGLLGGSVAGGCSLIFGLNKTRNLSASLARAAYTGLWGAVLGGTYISVVHLSHMVRQKDTITNHGLAGIATGFMLGVKYQKQIVGWRAAPLIGSAALLIKDAQLKGMLDDVRPLRQHFQAPDERGRFITPQGYRNAVSTYDPEKQIYKIPISDLIPIMEEREK